MKTIIQPKIIKRLRAVIISTSLIAGATALAACGASSTPTPATQPVGNASTPATQPVGNASVVLPVTTNPITNSSTIQALKIESVLVENNLDSTGQIASDHLEIALVNTGQTELKVFEIFYTFTDQAKSITESYYTKLPGSFTLPAGGKRIVHFDNTGALDHFPVSEFSLYYTDTNVLQVAVTVSAIDSAVQTTSMQKDAGGPEAAD
jgi:hypothetical protein